MLSLDYLQEMTLPEVWRRGEDYYSNNLVKNLKNSDNRWTAVVKGSYKYRVSITVNGNEIENWDCNCPYDYGPVCKHVIAVALAVEEKLKKVETGIISNAIVVEEPLITTQNKIKDVPDKDLKHFCEEYDKQHPGFQTGLAEYLDIPVHKEMINYAQKIRKAADKASGQFGFIDYYHASEAFNIVFKYLDKAESLLQKNNFEEVFQITKAVFEEVSDMCQHLDDSNGMTGDSLYHCQELLQNLLVSAPDELKNTIFDWLMKEYPKKKYQGFLGDDILLDLLTDAAKSINKTTKIILLLTKALENSDSEFKQKRILLATLDLLSFSGQNNELEILINKHIHIPEIRKIRIEELIKEEKYSEAEQLINNGIEIARQRMNRGTEIEWYKQLSEIYNKTGSTKKQLELTHILFKIDSHSRTSHLERLKKFYNPDKWVVERDKLIAWLKEKRDWYLFEFYVFEEMWPELFQLLKNNPQYHLLQQYGHLLVKDFGEDIIKIYAVTFRQKAKLANNRKMYKELKTNLNSVKKYKGGPALVKQLVSEFRETYKNRPAMMDELSVF